MKAALRQILLEDDAVQRLTEGRVYSNVAPQQTRQPRVSMQVLNTEPMHVTTGRSDPSAKTVEILVLAEKEVDCTELAERIIAILDRIARKTGVRTEQGVIIHDIFLDNDVDGFDHYGASEQGLYRRNLDFQVWFEKES